MTNLNKYEATWVMQDGTPHKEQFEAEGFEVLPNGVVLFYVFPAATSIKLVANPSDPASQPKPDFIGTAAGHLAVHKL